MALERVQWLRVSVAFAEDPSLVFSVLVEQPTTTCNSSSRGSYALFWTLQATARRHVHTPTTYVHMVFSL